MSDSARAHGLDGSLVTPDWPPLTFEELRNVLKEFPGVGEPAAILSRSPRPFSAASVIQTRTGRIFVKRHARSVRNAEALAEEHHFMRHLLAHGIQVPQILTTQSVDSAVEIGESTYEVHSIPSGNDLYEDAISWTPFLASGHARSAGELLARMHLEAASFDAPARKVRPLVASFAIFASPDPAKSLRTYLAARPALEDDAATRIDCTRSLELLAPFHQELYPLLASLPTLWTHNDLHASNLFWSDATPDARAASVIDFGLSDRTYAVHDLAHAIERNIIEWLVLMRNSKAGVDVPVHLDHLWALLEGYDSVRALTSVEASAVAPMLALCHAEFALTEAHYFLSALNSPDKARIATRDYLIGHAEWFRGPGQHLILDPLRRWAEARRREAVGA